MSDDTPVFGIQHFDPWDFEDDDSTPILSKDAAEVFGNRSFEMEITVDPEAMALFFQEFRRDYTHVLEMGGHRMQVRFIEQVSDSYNFEFVRYECGPHYLHLWDKGHVIMRSGRVDPLSLKCVKCGDKLVENLHGNIDVVKEKTRRDCHVAEAA